MRIVDIRALAARAHEVGAKVAVDNTFLSPALQRPILLGADYVVHSTTKYLNGHSDVVGGVVVTAAKADADALADWTNVTGTSGAPFDAYLTLRGLRSLFPRVEQQQRTAGALAAFLQGHPRVRAVHYPGLATHPGHAVAKAQQAGFGAMLSFELAGDVADLRRFVGGLRVFTLAESLGGVESLIAHPATMTHASMSAEARRVAGISDTLLRLSVGLEAEGDLLRDLEGGFAALAAPLRAVSSRPRAAG
jgi:cystathionine gamma-synthase